MGKKLICLVLALAFFLAVFGCQKAETEGRQLVDLTAADVAEIDFIYVQYWDEGTGERRSEEIDDRDFIKKVVRELNAFRYQDTEPIPIGEGDGAGWRYTIGVYKKLDEPWSGGFEVRPNFLIGSFCAAKDYFELPMDTGLRYNCEPDALEGLQKILDKAMKIER